MSRQSVRANGWEPYRARLLTGHRLRAKIEISYATDQGLRCPTRTEAPASTYWAVVSDGAGGRASGHEAAALAVEVVASRLGGSDTGVNEALVLDALAEANTAVPVAPPSRGPAKRYGGHAHYCRLYVIRGGGEPLDRRQPGRLAGMALELRGSDPSERGGQPRRRTRPSGAAFFRELTGPPGPPRNYQSAWVADEVAPHINYATLRPGDQLILACDGIEVLTEAEISATIARPDDEGLSTAERLVGSAVSAGVADNVTVAVLRHSSHDAGGLTFQTQSKAERTG